MIRVRFRKRGGQLVGVDVSGHAGWERAGQDIVCAAVSALVRSTARALARRGGTMVRFEAPEPGAVRLETGPNQDAWADGAWAVLDVGLKDLAHEYPQSVMVETEESR